MESRKVEVIRYYACDGKEFDNEAVCYAHEKELKLQLLHDIQLQKVKILRLKNEKNRTRLQFLVAKCDAFDCLHDKDRVVFHENMAEYYKGKLDYQIFAEDLTDAYREVNRLYDIAYAWFGTYRHKSRIAKIERMDRSLRWRKENTPDKWRTPYKIRVSKLPKEDNNTMKEKA